MIPIEITTILKSKNKININYFKKLLAAFKQENMYLLPNITNNKKYFSLREEILAYYLDPIYIFPKVML